MRKVTRMNKEWTFIKENIKVSESSSAIGEKIDLPHTWNNFDGQDGGMDYVRGTFNYVKSFEKPPIVKGERLYVEFNGINSIADVFINEILVAHHEGGYSTFRADITDNLKDENILFVKADNSQNDHIYPQFADFTFYGGIYRDVNFVTVANTHFDMDYLGSCGIMVTPNVIGENASIEIKTFIVNKKDTQQLRITIFNKQGDILISTTNAINIDIVTVEINNVRLWNGTLDPYLYTLKAEIIENEMILDNQAVNFGVRTFNVDPNKGFILNGKPYNLHGVSRHMDRQDLGSAISIKEHIEDMELIKEVGANTIRLAHYQHDQTFLNLCDEFGMVVWAEIPFISRFLVDGEKNSLSQMEELIVQNYNHTSVVCWGLSNEITIGGESEALLQNNIKLNNLCHEMDKTRLTTMAQVSMLETESEMNNISDILSYNLYLGWYGGHVEDNAEWFDTFHQIFPNKCIGLSEYGAEGILSWHSSIPKMGDYSEEYQALYHEKMLAIFVTRPFIWSTHVWNMFDFGSDMRNEGGIKGRNNKGLVTFDRKTKKDSFFAYKAYWSNEKFLHLCGKRYIDRAEEVTSVKVYSNLFEISIFLNGIFIETKQANKVFNFEIPIAMGENIIEVKSSTFYDKLTINRVEHINKEYIYEDNDCSITNWFDANGEEQIFEYKNGFYSIKDSLKEISETLQGKAIVDMLLKQIAENMEKSGQYGVAEGLSKILMRFTIERLAQMGGADAFPAERLYKLNVMLNNIKK